MSRGLRQSQATLHTWSGLLLGWLLFLVFLTGTIAFWREALNRYMRPELPPVEQPLRILAGAQGFLGHAAPDAAKWYIAMPGGGVSGAQLFWTPQPARGKPAPRSIRDTSALIGADGRPVHARDTRGGEFFYRFHFDLYYLPVIWSRWIVGVSAALMLVAILSGIVTHKKIFRDFFTLRRHRGQRSWLDGHNALAVLALPFHLMITYTGLVTLMALLMPWAAMANYKGLAQASEALFPHVRVEPRSGTAAPLASLPAIVADAERRLGAPAGVVEVTQPGDAAARVTVTRAARTLLNTRSPSLAYDGVTGRPIWRSPRPGAAVVTAGVMVGLHAGRFADLALRWIYFLCGVAGTLMVASGLVLWTVKRRERLRDPARPPLGFRVVERLNVAVIAGFPFATAVFLWANRLLPIDLAGRAGREVDLLFVGWAAATLVALLRPPARGWRALFGATGVLLAMLPAFNLAAGPRGTIGPLLTGDWVPAGVDAVLLILAAGCLAIGRRVSRHQPPRQRRRPVAIATSVSP